MRTHTPGLRLTYPAITLLAALALSACGGEEEGSGAPAPVATPLTPTASATDVPVGTAIRATFSTTMNSSTLNTTTFTLTNGATPVAGSVSYSGLTATFSPSAPLQGNTTYTATIGMGAQSSSGVAMAAPLSWDFTTIGTSVVRVSWAANRETAVNTTGGGYRVHYAPFSGFTPGAGGTFTQDVPYVSGSSAPVSVDLSLSNGTWFFKIEAYSSLNRPGSTGGSSSQPSSQVSVVVP